MKDKDLELLKKLLYITENRTTLWYPKLSINRLFCAICNTIIASDFHKETCWSVKLAEIKARPDYESILAVLELQEEQT